MKTIESVRAAVRPVVLPKYPGCVTALTPEPVKGQICYNSWGWGQTNIDFYIVLKVTAKTVRIVGIKSETKEHGFMCGPTWPVFPIVEEGTDRRGPQTRHWSRDDFDVRAGRWHANMTYGCLLPWDGKEPLQCSWYN